MSGPPNRLPLWFTVLVISRDVAIVLTVAVVNLAVGPPHVPAVDFRQGCDGDVRLRPGSRRCTSTTSAAASRPLVQVLVYASLVITVVSAGHYLVQVVRMGH